MNDLAAQAERLGITLKLTSHPFSTVFQHCLRVDAYRGVCNWTAENWGAGWIYAPAFLPTGEPLFAPGSVVNEGGSTDAQMTSVINQRSRGPAARRSRRWPAMRSTWRSRSRWSLGSTQAGPYREMRGPWSPRTWAAIRPTPMDSYRTTGTSPKKYRAQALSPASDFLLTGFIIRRLGQANIVVLGVTLITLIELHLLPGSLARDILGNRARRMSSRQFNHQNRLDRPLSYQYWLFLDKLLHGTSGTLTSSTA